MIQEPGCDIAMFPFIVNKLEDEIALSLVPSVIVSTVNSLDFTIAFTSLSIQRQSIQGFII